VLVDPLRWRRSTWRCQRSGPATRRRSRMVCGRSTPAN